MPSNAEIYTKLTHALIKQMEKGNVPWVRPWRQAAGAFGAMPLNAATRRPYTGINVLFLWMEIEDKKYTSSGWCTYNQAKKAGAVVRRKEHGTPVMFMKKYRVDDPDKKGKKKDIFLVRTYTVFNLDQLDDVKDGAVALLRKRAGDAGTAAEKESTVTRLRTAETLVKSTGAVIKHGGNRACYSPRTDIIGMPALKQFEDRARYYGTLFHELTHWTGHDTRLDRHKLTWMQNEQYAMEELVAELGAAFLSARFGMEMVPQHAAYLKNWLKGLNNDISLIVKAASAATKAVSFVTGEVAEDFAEEAVVAPRPVAKRATRTKRRAKARR